MNADAIDGSANVQALFDEMGRLAGRPWVMLSAGAGKEAFRDILAHAFKAGASGFLAGRAIWLDAFTSYPDWDRIVEGLAGDGLGYLQDIAGMADRSAHPWHHHPCYADGGAIFQPADETFRHGYDGM